MTTLQWSLIKTMPVALGISLIAALPSYASETLESHPLDQTSAVEETQERDRPEAQQVDRNDQLIALLSLEKSSLISSKQLQPAEPELAPASAPTTGDLSEPTEAVQTVDDLEAPLESADETTEPVDDLSESSEPPSDEIELIEEPIESAEPAEELVEPIEEPSDSTPDTEELTAESPPSLDWRFTFEPYIYIPLHVDGEIGIGEFTSEIGDDTPLGEISDTIDVNINTNLASAIDTLRDTLIFGFMGRTEAWRGDFGIIFDGAYISLEQDNEINLAVPPRFQPIIPTDIDVETKFSYGQFDLAAGYRIADRSRFADAATDFDLGPLVFDVMGGLRLYTLSQSIDINTNLGNDRDFSRDSTIITPLISSRLRWNLSHNFALGIRGDMAGFGVDGLDLAWALTSGFDWMFSGNTSVSLGYRISSLDYSKEVRGRNVDVDLLFHGPYASFVFRF